MMDLFNNYSLSRAKATYDTFSFITFTFTSRWKKEKTPKKRGMQIQGKYQLKIINNLNNYLNICPCLQ